MTDSEKAKILDAIISEYGHVAEYLATGVRVQKYECDPSVGFVCEDCSADEIVKRIAGVSRFYETQIISAAAAQSSPAR